MLLTISTSHKPATDLGYLLHKNPSRVQSEELSFGKTHVFYPIATEDTCTAALMLEIDPIALVRARQGPSGDGHQFEQYVNDRPYAANSFLSVAIGRVFASALGGRSKERAELAETAIPLITRLPSIAGGEDLIRRLFEPLGYTVVLTTSALDEAFPEWGLSPYSSLVLSGTVRLRDLLTHLYVLIPVLDNEKHYWVGGEEIEKLLKRGEGGYPRTRSATSSFLAISNVSARSPARRWLFWFQKRPVTMRHPQTTPARGRWEVYIPSESQESAPLCAV